MLAPRVAAALALLTTSLCLAATDPQVKEGIALYDQGELAKARDALVTVVESPTLTTSDRSEARAYLAAAYQALGDVASAKAQLLVLAREQPGYRLDPGLFLPELIALSDEARAEVAREPKPPEPVRPQRLPPEEPATAHAAAPPTLTAPPQVVARPVPAPNAPPLGLMFVPFGVGQFSLDQDLKGTLFLTSEVVALGTSAVALAMFESNKTSGGFYQGGTFKDPDKAATLQTVHLVAGYTGLALMVGGVIDALISRSEVTSAAPGVALSGARSLQTEGLKVTYTGQSLLIRF